LSLQNFNFVVVQLVELQNRNTIGTPPKNILKNIFSKRTKYFSVWFYRGKFLILQIKNFPYGKTDGIRFFKSFS
jgi:hypothetical protein